MEENKTSPATDEEDRLEADSPHDADRPPTEDEERLADESRERYSDDAKSVADHERSMNKTGADEQGEGRIP